MITPNTAKPVALSTATGSVEDSQAILAEHESGAKALLDAALAYAVRGWPVLPLHGWTGSACTCGKADCGSAAKHPRTSNGLTDATTDDAIIRGWWTRWPEANIGLRTGIAFDVVDIDGSEGEASLREVLTAHGDPNGPQSRTGRGGRHLLVKPTGEGNRTGMLPKVDFRGDGGYVVAAPSIHASGNRYAWLIDPDRSLPEAPDWLRGLLAQKSKSKVAEPIPALIPSGERNATAASLAGSMRRRGMGVDAIYAALIAERDAGRFDQSHSPMTDDELHKVAVSIGTYAPAALRYPRSDAGNAELLAAMHGERVRYDHRRGRWLLWDGVRWASDIDGAVTRLALDAARARYHDAAKIEDLKDRAAESSWAIASESRTRLDAALAIARALDPIADAGVGWDADPWLLGVPNGVVDLRTGKLRTGRQEDRITMQAAVPFDPEAKSPRWESFIGEVFDGDADLIGYVRRYAGYTLTGVTNDESVFLAYGRGANGKSKLFEALSGALGDYAQAAPFSTFTVGKYGEQGPTNDLARLEGARLVTALETSKGSVFSEGRIKALTGRDPITARFLFREYVTFMPSLKLWLGVNHKPEVRDLSRGFWRRMRLIPFGVDFEGTGRMDIDLPDKLRAERAGILAWAVRACLEWQAIGLTPPAVVLDAVEAYKDEFDPLAEFLEDRCVRDPDAFTSRSALLESYNEWADGRGLSIRDRLGPKLLPAALEAQFPYARPKGKPRGYRGVALVSESYPTGAIKPGSALSDRERAEFATLARGFQ